MALTLAGGVMQQISERDWDVLEALQRGVPLAARPWAELAKVAGMEESEFLTRLRALRDSRAIRRMGFRLRHERAGVRGNIMVAWQVEPARVEEVGALFAGSEAVSHCYERPAFEGFPYNIYTMVHGRTPEEADRAVEELAALVGIERRAVLRSVREWKKSTPVYRRPEE